jgi:hypothetical protein
VDRGLSLVEKIVTAYDYIVSVAFAGATSCELRLDQVDYRVSDTRRRSLCSRLRGTPGLRRIRGGSPCSLTASEAIKRHACPNLLDVQGGSRGWGMFQGLYSLTGHE